MKTWIAWLLLAATLVVSGCSSSPLERKIKFAYTIVAAPDINPDIHGEPSSVVVRVIQLTNVPNFQAASYENVFTGLVNKLGNEFIAVDEHLIDPGATQVFKAEVSERAKFLGIAVGYRSSGAVTWKTVQPIPEKSLLDPFGFFSREGIVIEVGKLSVQVVPK